MLSSGEVTKVWFDDEGDDEHGAGDDEVYDVKKEDNDEDTAGAVVTAALVHGGEKLN